MKTYLGYSTDLQSIQQILELHNIDAVDIGCGSGDFAAELARLGARVTGIEPDPVQAKKNRKAPAVAGMTLLEAGAEGLPLADASQDLLVFRFSLHHIPPQLYPDVFREAARVLRPGGQLYVMEPLAEGSSQHVMELFHDETEVRKAAQEALRTLTPPYFKHANSYRYDVLRRYDDFAAYVERYDNMSYNDYGEHQVDNSEVESRFLKYKDEDGGYLLSQPVKADLFKVLA